MRISDWSSDVCSSDLGRVSLQAHGGIEMCGGRDWDRAIVANIVRPWLEKNFDLPEDASTNQAYRKLFAKLDWAAEKAKIELSSRDDAHHSLSDVDTGLRPQRPTTAATSGSPSPK